MSLFGALFSGVSGLQSQSSAMAAIADNVTNINTVGYKGTTVSFQTLITKQTSSTLFSPGGVQSKPRQNVDQQGLLQATTSSTDIAISGQGFFIVNEAAQPERGDIFGYSRAGSFTVDREGFLRNTGGYYLQGWPLTTYDGTPQAVRVSVGNDTYMKAYENTNGDRVIVNDNIIDSNNLRPLNLNTIGGTASATTTLSLGANLPSDDDVNDTNKTNALIFDSLGNAHNLQLDYVKTGANTWRTSYTTPATSAVLQQNTQNGEVHFATGRIDFLDEFQAPLEGEINLSIGSEDVAIHLKPSEDTLDDDFFGALTFDTTNDTVTATRDDAFNGLQVGDTFDVAGSASNDGTLTVTGMTRTFTDTPDTFGDLTFTNVGAAGTDTITATTATAFADVGVGDSVTFAGTASNNATYTVTAVSTDGLTITVAEDITTTETVTSGSGATVTAPVDQGGDTIYVAENLTNETLASGSGGTLTVPIADNSQYTSGGGDIMFINTTGRTMSQIIDELANRVNSFLTDTNVFGTAPAVPGNWGRRVEGENGVVFDQASNVAGLSFTASLTDNNGTELVYQNDPDGYTVPALDEDYGWYDIGTGELNQSSIQFSGNGTPEEFFGRGANLAPDPRYTLEIQWANGAENMEEGNPDSPPIEMFLGNYNTPDGITQLSGSFQLNFLSQNGARFGNFAGVTIGNSGVVTALFDNGVTRPVFMIPVATFVNSAGLEALTGNVWIETDFSGQPTVREAGDAGAGTINASALESSTVDLGEEFTRMITTQRAYTAASKVITTSDQLLDELLSIKR